MVATRQTISIPRRPVCPRCAYDQSGLVATWNEQCPLTATCTECGYAFDPADAFNPTRKRLPWLYEHAKPWSIPAILKTLCMLLWPPLFWKRVRPEHEVRITRLVALPFVALFAWPLVISVLMFVSAFVVIQTNAYGWHGQSPVGWGPAAAQAWAGVLSAAQRGELWETLVLLTPITGVVVYFMFVWLPTAAAFLAIPSAWAGTRLRGRHLVRTLAYAMFPMVLIFTLFSLGSVLIQLYEIAYTLALPRSQNWLSPWEIVSPETTMQVVVVALMVVWPALYWLAALRTGYHLPRALAAWAIVMMVHFVPAAFLLVSWAVMDGLIG